VLGLGDDVHPDGLAPGPEEPGHDRTGPAVADRTPVHPETGRMQGLVLVKKASSAVQTS
jgi:hypothetical protein